jgi:hypothetical protein
MAIAVLVFFVVGAWWWPGLTGQDGQLDVLIVSSSSESGAREVIDRRLREEGLTTAWHPSEISGCTFPSPIDDSQVLVILLPGPDVCSVGRMSEILSRQSFAFSDRRVVAVVPWSHWSLTESEMTSLRNERMRVVDPRSLIGRDGESQPCLWWDDCPLTGSVTTIENSTLTVAGHQRIARSIVAGVL